MCILHTTDGHPGLNKQANAKTRSQNSRRIKRQDTQAVNIYERDPPQRSFPPPLLLSSPPFPSLALLSLPSPPSPSQSKLRPRTRSSLYVAGYVHNPRGLREVTRIPDEKLGQDGFKGKISLSLPFCCSVAKGDLFPRLHV